MVGFMGESEHDCVTTAGDFGDGDTTSGVVAGKSDNPLNDPVVRASLCQAKLSGSELIDMTVKELNKRLAHCPAHIVNKLKRCRRTLKNRGYAKNCRIKRIASIRKMEQLIVRKDQVIAAKNQVIEELQQRLRSLQSASLLAPVTKVNIGTQPTYEHQNHRICNNNYQQQQQWQQREPIEQVSCRQQQHCFKTLQEAEVGYVDLLDPDDHLKQVCQLEQQQMVVEKQPISEMMMTSYHHWTPSFGQF